MHMHTQTYYQIYMTGVFKSSETHNHTHIHIERTQIHRFHLGTYLNSVSEVDANNV